MNDSKKVLIVDDDDGIRDVLTTLLEAKSYEVKDFEHGYDAVSYTQSNKAAVVLLDYFLPGESAENIIKSLHQINSDLVILLMSANMNVKMNFKELGVSEFIRKPFSIDLIYSTLNKYIN